MASGDEKAASQAGHMAAPTSNANAQLTLAKGEPSTQGAKLPQHRFGREQPFRFRLGVENGFQSAERSSSQKYRQAFG